MCSGVSRLEVPVFGRDYESLDALCDCLRAWSSTLEHLSLNIYINSYTRLQYQPLSDALSTPIFLRELVALDLILDMDAIANLPRLEEVRGSPYGSGDLIRFSEGLRDANKFPSLKSTNILVNSRINAEEGRKEVEKSCIERKINLRWF